VLGGVDPTSFVNANGKAAATTAVSGPFGFGDAVYLDNNKVGKGAFTCANMCDMMPLSLVKNEIIVFFG